MMSPLLSLLMLCVLPLEASEPAPAPKGAFETILDINLGTGELRWFPISFEEEKLTDNDHLELHAALNVILTYKHTDDVESTHTQASLFEGDIKLTEEQRTNNMLFGNPEGGTSRAATNVDKIKWPNGVIPYEFDCSVGEYLRGFSSFYK